MIPVNASCFGNGKENIDTVIINLGKNLIKNTIIDKNTVKSSNAIAKELSFRERYLKNCVCGP